MPLKTKKKSLFSVGNWPKTSPNLFFCSKKMPPWATSIQWLWVGFSDFKNCIFSIIKENHWKSVILKPWKLTLIFCVMDWVRPRLDLLLNSPSGSCVLYDSRKNSATEMLTFYCFFNQSKNSFLIQTGQICYIVIGWNSSK